MQASAPKPSEHRLGRRDAILVSHLRASRADPRLSLRAIVWAWKHQLPPVEKLTLLALADIADEEAKCWPSRAYICNQTGLSTTTVSRAVAALCEKGLLQRESRFIEGRQRSNMFHLAMHVEGCRSDTPQTVEGDQSDTPGVSERPANKTPSLEPFDPSLRSGSSQALDERAATPALIHPVGAGGEVLLRKIENEMKRGRKSWDMPRFAAKTWDELGEPNDLQARIRFVADYINLLAGTEDIDFRRIGRLVKRWGKVALRGVDVALAKGDLEGAALYNYAEKVCQASAQRITERRSDEEASSAAR